MANEHLINQHEINKFSRQVMMSGKEDCWPWTGSTNSQGYGYFVLSRRDSQGNPSFSDKSGMQSFCASIYRIAWVLSHDFEPLEKGKKVKGCQHDILCVNPRHLSMSASNRTRQRGQRINRQEPVSALDTCLDPDCACPYHKQFD